MTAKYVLGIDLGTTNSVLAYSPLDAAEPQVEVLPIPQLVAAGTVETRTMLPSFLYLAHPREAESGAFDLPWAEGRTFAVGELARRQAAEVPDRTVGAAKSWLAYSRVDRRQPILPWGAPAEVAKVSPVSASQRFLEHLVAAWQQAFPDAPVAEQLVVLTVPASFDASARELTREAALAAGLPEAMVLLEEPQAAVYAWLGSLGNRWRRMLSVGDQLLVCDVGGGTTDLTLVAVAEEAGDLVLERMAVGNHLLVGGDNMDLALAHHAAGLFGGKGVKLNPWQSVALWHSCRTAKEALLVADGPAAYPVSVLGRGSRLIGGTISLEVGRRRASCWSRGFSPNARWATVRPNAGSRVSRSWDCPSRATRPSLATWRPFSRTTAPRRASRSGPATCCSTAACSRPMCSAPGSWRCLADGFPRAEKGTGPICAKHPPGRSGKLDLSPFPPRSCFPASTIWTTPWPAERRTTATPSSAAACGSAAARPGRITWASRRPGWRSPVLGVRCARFAWRRWAWRRAVKRTFLRRRSG
jgi:hypothetical protein